MKKDGRAMNRAQSFEHLKGLDGISDSQLAEHLDLYAGYVKQVNALTQELSEMRSERRASGKDFGLAEGTRRLALEYDGMVLHEFYFSNLKPGGAARPSDRQAFGRALAETERPKYVEAFFRNIDWHVVDQRFNEEPGLRSPSAA